MEIKMTIPILDYGNLKVSPFELVQLQDLTLTKKINDHGRLNFRGIISEDKKDTYVHAVNNKTSVKIDMVVNAKETPLFNGIVMNIAIKKVRDIYYIEVDAISYTYLLDIQLKKRSFQDKSMNHYTLVKNIVQNYGDADFIYAEKQDTSIGNLTIQYEETDWEFLKRMASRFHTGLVPYIVSDKIQFFFGIPTSGTTEKLDDFMYSVKKRLSDYRYSNENKLSSTQEQDFIVFQIQTEKLIEIGSSVLFKGRTFYVQEALTTIENGILLHEYSLSTRAGLEQKKVFNNSFKGLSIGGQVIAVQRDKVKVHLKIDAKQDKAKAYFFPYATIYASADGSGMYCMPEIGDSIRISFPNNLEEEAIAISSVSQYNPDQGIPSEQDKMGDPNVRYLRNPAGMEVKLTPTTVQITAKDGQAYIIMDEAGHITVSGKKDIRMTAAENVVIRAEKGIIISAGEEVSIGCDKGGKIILDKGGNVNIQGTEVFNN